MTEHKPIVMVSPDKETKIRIHSDGFVQPMGAILKEVGKKIEASSKSALDVLPEGATAVDAFLFLGWTMHE